MTLTTKTREFIHMLPDAGAVVVVHSKARSAEMLRYIHDIRGSAVASNIRVEIVGAASHAEALRGEDTPTFVDVEFEGSKTATEALTKAVSGINATIRPAPAQAAGCTTCGTSIDAPEASAEGQTGPRPSY